MTTTISENLTSFYRLQNEGLISLARDNLKMYIAHFVTNKQHMLDLAKDVSGVALVLGLGNGYDIPLEALALQFDSVTVIDIDLEGMEKCIAKLPEALRAKVIPVQQDLTGVVTKVIEKVSRLSNELTEAKCVTKVIQIVKEVLKNPNDVLVPGSFDFVVSSMVTTQLHSFLHEALIDELVRKYAYFKQKQVRNVNYQLPILFTINPLSLAHLDLLHKWTKPEGKIYYADTVISYSTSWKFPADDPKQKPILELEYGGDCLQNKDIKTRIETHFQELKDSAEWYWETKSPGDNLSGCVMKVRAYSLTKKNDITSQVEESS